jgi:hypothetical protein
MRIRSSTATRRALLQSSGSAPLDGRGPDPHEGRGSGSTSTRFPRPVSGQRAPSRHRLATVPPHDELLSPDTTKR